MPERAGWIDRNRLGDFSGSGRRARLDLARWLAVPEIPENAGPGCRLTAPGAAARLHDLIRFHAAAPGWELELLTCGRHFRFHESTKVVLGRREEENLALGKLYRAAPAGRAALISPQGFPGPTALVSGVCGEEEMAFACGLLHRFAKLPGNSPERTVAVEHAGDQWELPARQHAAAEQAVAIS